MIMLMLREFIALGGQRIDITGGEPLMRKNIDSVLQLAIPEMRLRTELVTNSLLLKDERLRRFVVMGLNEIAISLDGSTFETHSRIRGVSERAFRKVLANIKRAAELGIKTKINTVVFASNFHELADITQLAINLGAREHGFYFFSPIGRGESDADNVADAKDWLKLVRERLAKFAGKIKISLEVPILETKRAEKLETRCYLEDPWHLQILPDGNVYPCAIMAACGKPIGNLYDKSLGEIWEDEGLWSGEYYRKNVLPLMEKHNGCVPYSFSHLVASGEYQFVCLCRKFSPQEVC